MVPASSMSKIKRGPKIIPLNGLAYVALIGTTPGMGGRFSSQWVNGSSFKYSWMRTCERAGLCNLHFHDLRHTFTTWLTNAVSIMS